MWTATSLQLDGATIEDSGNKSGDPANPVEGATLLISPTDIDFGSAPGPLATDIVKSWTGQNGVAYTETLTAVESISPSPSTSSIAITLTGTLSGGVFDNTPAVMDLSATQEGGAGNIISVSGTNISSTVPEPSTWVMLALGFLGLGYAAVRRSAKDRSALAV